jgi:predicted DNA-binding transcriptional regulator AlpA
MPEFLTAEQVCAAIHVSLRTLRRAIADGDFPAPVKIRPRFARWVKTDIDDRLASRNS